MEGPTKPANSNFFLKLENLKFSSKTKSLYIDTVSMIHQADNTELLS